MKAATILIAILLIAISSFGAIISVPADQPTIQAGINAANDFDTVLVAPGTYTGDGNRDIDFVGKRVYLKGGGKFGNDVTIDCAANISDQHWAIRFNTGEDSNAVVDGFTITGAYSSAGAPIAVYFGAVQCEGTSPIIRNCTVWHNAHYGIASGQGANPKIEDCWIEHNLTGIQIGRHPMLGGGDARILRTVVRNNDSCGIELLHYGTRDIENCLVLGNGADGIRLLIDMPKPTEQVTPATPSAVVRRTIILNNGRHGAAGLWLGNGQMLVECSDSYGNGFDDYFAVVGDAGDTLGNLSADPLFCFPDTSNYFIRDNSPCASANNSCGAQIGPFGVACTCCRGITGNVNMSVADTPDLTDLSMLIHYLTVTPRISLPCRTEANVNSDGAGLVDLSDLSKLIDYFTAIWPRMPNCRPPY